MRKTTKGRRSLGPSAVPQRLDALARTEPAALLELLERLPDERGRALLLLRHGLGLSWPAIRSAAERHGLCYSERHLFRLYALALAQAEALRGGTREA